MKKILLTLALAASTLSIKAQEGGLAELVEGSLKAMKDGSWEDALELNSQAIALGQNPETALQLYGARFGTIYYRKGLCEQKLDKFDDAMKSFETCYQVFTGGENQFNKMALLKWGEAAFSLQNYELALTQWKKFLNERERVKDVFPQGSLHTSMAIANFRTGQLPAGIEHLEIAIKNKNVFPTPNEAIATGFQALAAAAIGSINEQALIDFATKNRGNLTIEPYAMQKFSNLYLKVAGDALAAEMPDSALMLYQFVPSNLEIIDDLKARLKAMGKLSQIPIGNHRLSKDALETQLAEAEAAQTSENTVEAIKLSATAYIHELNGNPHGAYACYLLLETFFPGAEKRGDNLFHLIRTASVIEKNDDALKYGEIFLSSFPASEHKANAYKLMLSSLFYDAKYEKCIQLASGILDNDKVDKDTEEHDLVSFVLAGSYFYTGKYKEAEPLLAEHSSLYQKSPFAMTVSYFHAASLSRLLEFKKALVLFDNFIEKYKDAKNKTYLPLAIFDRANIYYSQEDYDNSLRDLSILIDNYSGVGLIDQVHNLRGSVLQMQEKPKDAEKAFIKAFDVANERGNVGIAGESLYLLISLLKEPIEGEDNDARAKQVVTYSDMYWTKYAEKSPYQSQVAIDQAISMEGQGRGDEALKRLQSVISLMSTYENSSGLESAINSYTELYLKANTPEQLKEHYYNFPDVPSSNKTTNALLRIALIGVYEKLPRTEKDPEKLRAAEAMITVLFQGLKSDFALNELSTYILVKLGDYLRTNTESPREALTFYNEAFARNDDVYRLAAVLGRADIYGQSDNKSDLDKALTDLELIFNESQDKVQREFSLFRTIEILMKKADFDAAAKRANQYLNKDKDQSLGFRKFEAQVGYMLAQSFEKRGMSDDAISMYVKVWGAHMGKISISAPAIESWMTLSYKRDRPALEPNILSDRQGAYEGGYRYLELTGRSKAKFNPVDLASWQRVEKLTAQYEEDPKIMSMARILKEKEQGR